MFSYSQMVGSQDVHCVHWVNRLLYNLFPVLFLFLAVVSYKVKIVIVKECLSLSVMSIMI